MNNIPLQETESSSDPEAELPLDLLGGDLEVLALDGAAAAVDRPRRAQDVRLGQQHAGRHRHVVRRAWTRGTASPTPKRGHTHLRCT